LYQTNEPIFYIFFRLASIRDIFNDKNSGKIGALNTLALIFFTA